MLRFPQEGPTTLRGGGTWAGGPPLDTSCEQRRSKEGCMCMWVKGEGEDVQEFQEQTPRAEVHQVRLEYQERLTL